MTKVVKVSLRGVPTVDDIEPVTLDIDGRDMTFTCPPFKIWRASELAMMLVDGRGSDDVDAADMKAAYEALHAFMAAALGGERAYQRFARRYDEHHLLIVFNALRQAWKDEIADLGARAAELTRAAARDGG